MINHFIFLFSKNTQISFIRFFYSVLFFFKKDFFSICLEDNQTKENINYPDLNFFF